MTCAEFGAFWSGADIIRWDRQILVDLNAPHEVIVGLVDWGLPLSDRFPWLAVASGHNLSQDDHFGRDKDFCLRLASPRRDGHRYRTFCFDYSIPICFDTEEDWAIVEMVSGDYDPRFKWNNPEVHRPEVRFVNLGILQFLESLTAEVQCLCHARTEDTEGTSIRRKDVQRFERCLRAIDSAAFASSENVWPLRCWELNEEAC